MSKKNISMLCICLTLTVTHLFSLQNEKLPPSELTMANQHIITLDQYNADNRFQDSMELFTPKVVKNMNYDLMWRYGRACWFYSEKHRLKKNEKKSIYRKVLNIIEKGLNPEVKEPVRREEMARLYYWYAVLKSALAQQNGIKASLGIIPGIFKLCDIAEELDSTYHRSYYLKSQLYHRLPFFAGGSSLLAGYYAELSVQYSPADKLDHAVVLADAVTILKKRGWSLDKKRSKYIAEGLFEKSDGLELMDDKLLAVQFKIEAVGVLSALNSVFIEVEKARGLLY